MASVSKTVLVILTAIICVSFFLPWVAVESPLVGGFSKVLTGKSQTTIDAISGFKVPVLANSPDSRFMISVIQIFNPGIKNADKKSYLIWVVPLLAVLLAVLAVVFEQNKWVHLSVAIIGSAIFTVAVYKIATTDLDKAVLKASVAYGLWLILYAYLAMAALSILNFIRTLKTT